MAIWPSTLALPTPHSSPGGAGWRCVLVRSVELCSAVLVYIILIRVIHRGGGLPGFVPKKGRRIWSKRVTWVLLHAAQILVRSPEVGELEIALSFALLRMSWDR